MQPKPGVHEGVRLRKWGGVSKGKQARPTLRNYADLIGRAALAFPLQEKMQNRTDYRATAAGLPTFMP